MSRALFLALMLLASTVGNVHASVASPSVSDTVHIGAWKGPEEPDGSQVPEDGQNTGDNQGSGNQPSSDNSGAGNTGNSNGNSGGDNSGNNSGNTGGGGGFQFDPLSWLNPANIGKALTDAFVGIVVQPVQDTIHQQLMGFPCGNIVTYTDPKCTTEWDVLKPFIDKAMAAPFFFIIWSAYISHLLEAPKRKHSALERAMYHAELQWFAMAAIVAWSVRDTLGPAAIEVVNFLDAQVPEPDMGALLSFGGSTVSGTMLSAMFPPAAALLNAVIFGLDLLFVGVLYAVIILRWFAIDLGLVFAGPILALLAHRRVRTRVEMILYAYIGILICQPFYKFGLSLLIDMRKAFPASQALAGGLILIAGLWVLINLIWYSKSFFQAFPGERVTYATSVFRRRAA